MPNLHIDIVCHGNKQLVMLTGTLLATILGLLANDLRSIRYRNKLATTKFDSGVMFSLS